MITGLILIAICLFIAGASNAVMDVLKYKYTNSIFFLFSNQRWFNKDSWKNKYKNRDPEQGEAFWGSTTIFVWVTDAWHFFQMLWRTFMVLVLTVGVFVTMNFSMWLFFSIFVVSSSIYLLTFNLFYEKILRI